MKIEDFKKTKEELAEQKTRNDEIISVSDERTRMANVNQIDHKLFTTFAGSMFPYFGLVLGSGFLDRIVDMTAFTNIIPAYTIPMILVGSSLCVGTIINKSLEKKYQTKERFNAFSNAKTQAEKVEEEIFYKIEIEKANNRNRVIQKTIDTLESNQSLLQTLSNRYDINEKDVPQTEKDAKKRLEELSQVLEQKYNELDILTTQRVLSESFWRLRCKGQKGIDLTIVIMGGGLMSMMITGMPLITMNNAFASCSMLARSLITFLPLTVGALGTSAYWINRNKSRKIALNNLNNKLGGNALPQKVENTYDEGQKLEAMIERKISDISVVEVQLKETQRVLERIVSERSAQNDIEHSLGRNSVENIIENSTQFPDGVHLPTAFEIPRSEPDISWVQPYLEEDIETGERITSDNPPTQGPKRVRKNRHYRTKNGVGD